MQKRQRVLVNIERIKCRLKHFMTSSNYTGETGTNTNRPDTLQTETKHNAIQNRDNRCMQIQ